MSIDPLRIGDFHLITASVVAWLAIGLVAILSVLVPERKAEPGSARVSTSLKRAAPTTASPATSTEPEPEAPPT